MSRWTRSNGACEKVPTIVLSQVDSSSNGDNTVSISLQLTRNLQRRFDRGIDDPTPSGGIHIAHYTRSRCSVEMASASSQSRTSSGGGSSLFPRTKEGRGPRDEELEEELMFDIDADLVALDGARPGPGPGAQRR